MILTFGCFPWGQALWAPPYSQNSNLFKHCVINTGIEQDSYENATVEVIQKNHTICYLIKLKTVKKKKMLFHLCVIIVNIITNAWPNPRPHWLQSFQGDWSQAKAMCMVEPKATPAPVLSGLEPAKVMCLAEPKATLSLWDPYLSLPIHSQCHWAVQHGMLRPWLQQILFTSIHYCIGKQAHLLHHISQDWDSKP